MKNSTLDTRLSRNLAILVALISIFTWKSGTDPVNVPKQFILSLVAFIFFGLIVGRKSHLTVSSNRLLFFSVGLFFLALLNSLLFADAPFTHMFYGVVGRSIGFITYISLGFIFLSSALNSSKSQPKFLFHAMSIVAAYNVIICIFEINGKEILGYNNIFRSILGTFGNPDFISAFFGIAGCMVFALLFNVKYSKLLRLFYFLSLLILIYLIFASKARQGILVFIAGIAVVFFLYIKQELRNKTFLVTFSLVGLLGFILTLAGTLNKGPLANLIYKVSLSLRGEYWHAAWNMILSNPLHGVGLNSYGDWYRFSRESSALVIPGSEIVTNSSHSVILDHGATGGIPLLISYLLIQIVIVLAILKIVRLEKTFDGYIAAIIAGWVAFSLQSLISIDQIGVSVWGWILGGAIYSHAKNINDNEFRESKTSDLGRKTRGLNVNTKSTISASAVLTSSIFGLIGLIVALPAFRADLEWGKAMRSGDIQVIKSAANRWPQDEMRLGNASFIFGSNKLWDEALAYSYKTLEFNPRSYSVWRMILNNPRATRSQRTKALQEMRKLDPKNSSLSDSLLENLKAP